MPVCSQILRRFGVQQAGGSSIPVINTGQSGWTTSGGKGAFAGTESLSGAERDEIHHIRPNFQVVMEAAYGSIRARKVPGWCVSLGKVWLIEKVQRGLLTVSTSFSTAGLHNQIYPCQKQPQKVRKKATVMIWRGQSHPGAGIGIFRTSPSTVSVFSGFAKARV